jgi:hypothetical protein
MSTTLHILHWIAGFIVLAEALNKLERTAPCAPGLSSHDRLVSALKALAWALLALGGGAAVVTPLMGGLGIHSSTSLAILHQAPSVAETLTLVGFAVLIIRTRVKEG